MNLKRIFCVLHHNFQNGQCTRCGDYKILQRRELRSKIIYMIAFIKGFFKRRLMIVCYFKGHTYIDVDLGGSGKWVNRDHCLRCGKILPDENAPLSQLVFRKK